jgi:sugar transferase (PEP-CTERM/EpsH1 system associated)
VTDLLFLAHRAPSAPDRGDRIRSFHVLKHLADRARVHVIAFDEGDAARPDLPLAGWTVIPRTRSRVAAVATALATGKPVSLTAFNDPALTVAVARVPHDVVYCFSGQMAQHVPATSPFVMDFVDVDSAKFAALAADRRGPAAWLYAREARLLARIERQVASRARASLFVSDAEAALFRDAVGSERVRTIGNGIDAAHFDPARVEPVDAGGEGPLVVFTGQMDYLPNVEACRWFVRAVLPQVPEMRFAIVGRAPTAAVRALAGPRVIVTGEVADTRPWLAAAAACVAPLHLARGIQNKVLEAMAMARPVIASPAAAEGIDHGGTIRVSDRDGFATALATLLAAPGAIGPQARARVLARYGWSARLAPLDALMDLDRALAA